MEESPEKGVFDIFDRGRTGQISREDAVQGLRVLGLNPTEAEVGSLFENLGEQVSFEEFTQLAKNCRKSSKTTKEEVAKFFESLEKREGDYVDLQELKTALMNSGDALSEAEIRQVFSKYEGSTRIKVSEFINEIFS